MPSDLSTTEGNGTRSVPTTFDADLFRFDAKAGEYKPDSPLPDCSDYTVP